MPKKKPYFHNNVEAIREAPDAFFIPIPFDEFMDWKIGGYELPSSCNYIIREQNIKTGKVKEYSYKYRAAAENKIRALVHTHEFVVCDHDSIHKLSPHPDNREKTNKADTSS